jgi:hypothetical protein
VVYLKKVFFKKENFRKVFGKNQIFLKKEKSLLEKEKVFWKRGIF